LLQNFLSEAQTRETRYNSVIFLTETIKEYKCTKHIDGRYYFISEKIDVGDIKITKVQSKNNIANLIMKALLKVIVMKHLKKMRIDIGQEKTPNIRE